jgi:hypothetical protein
LARPKIRTAPQARAVIFYSFAIVAQKFGKFLPRFICLQLTDIRKLDHMIRLGNIQRIVLIRRRIRMPHQKNIFQPVSENRHLSFSFF